MHRKYLHLTKEDRDKIAVLRAKGLSLSAIGKVLGRNKSTISRELTRNAPPIHKGYYLSHKADERASERWMSSHKSIRLKDQEIREYVDTKIQQRWSPELIAGRLPIDKPGLSISYEAIYQYIYEEKRELIPCLVRQHKKRKIRGYSRKHIRSHIPNRISIVERPKVVTKRKRLGDWETDSLVSRKSKTALNVLVDRTSRLVRITILTSKTAEQNSIAIEKALENYPNHAKLTITYDNGSENTQHERTNMMLGTTSYFCNPYHSWEKGTVENINGLIRRWLPKGTDFSKITNMEVKRLENWINNRPMKCLKFRTPVEFFNALSKKLSVVALAA